MNDSMEVLAVKIARLLKKEEPDESCLRLTPATVTLAENDGGRTRVKLSTGGELILLNKSGEVLELGDSVWIAWQRSLADGVILLRNGPPEMKGACEDLGKGNTRLDRYKTEWGNIIQIDIDSDGCYCVVAGGYNGYVKEGTASFIHGEDLSVEKASCSAVFGIHNKVYANTDIIGGEHNTVGVKDASANGKNIVGGYMNICRHEANIEGGQYNVTGAIPRIKRDFITDPEDSNAFDTNTDLGSGYNMLGGDHNSAAGNSVAGGHDNIAADASFTAGQHNIAVDHSAAVGWNCKAIGSSFAGGHMCAAGSQWNQERTDDTNPYDGYMNVKYSAFGKCNFAFGRNCTAVGNSAAIGNELYNSAQDSFVCGRYNKIFGRGSPESYNYLFYVGNGSSADRSNALELDVSGNLMIKGSLSSGGADQAEWFEWYDSNPDNEDRTGRFVTLEGEKIRPADKDDSYILGVVSATPTLIGNSDSGTWHGKYRKDVFGRIMYKTEGKERIPVLSDEYDAQKNYIPRAERKEWAVVSSSGRLILIDDGSCEVNGYCCPTTRGIAGKSAIPTAYRVIKRIDENHIMVYIK